MKKNGKRLPALIGLLIFSLCCISSVPAQQRTHQVQRGETLFSIAQKYEIPIEKLKEWNDLQDNNLTVGQTLMITPPESADQTVTYEIQPRETLFSISKKFNVSIAEIKRWNNLETNTLEAGQKLTLYPDTTAVDTAGNRQGSLVVNRDTRQNSYYTVKSGDTLYEIAQTHDMSVEELRELNDLSNNTIAIGQKLTVRKTTAPPSVSSSATESSPQGKFATHEISKTQSLEGLLEAFNMYEIEFKALNPDLTSATLRPGQKVTVLAPPTKWYENPYQGSANLENLGTAQISKYSDSEIHKTTTSGELHNPGELTAAHSNISLGSVLYIENPENNRGIYVRINDRISENGLKLSAAAWKALEIRSANPAVNIYQDQ